MRLISQSLSVLLCLALCVSLSSPSVAQTSDALAKAENSQAKDKQFAEKFWNYLLSNNYKHWSPAPGKSAGHFASQTVNGTNLGANVPSPHGTNVKMYVNRTAASSPNSLPVGSVLILENYRQDKSLESISVMYRTPGFNPSANDWYWVNYNADGSITSDQNATRINSLDSKGVHRASAAATFPKKLVGRSEACIECHKAGGGDLAFFNNRIDPQTAITPIVNQPAKQAVPARQAKLQVQPNATFKQGAQQNFNMVLPNKTVLPNSP